MKLRYLSLGITAVILSVTACKKDKNNTSLSGTADFSRYIAVGNSITSGFANGGLYLAGQQMAFPNLLAKQLQLAGGGTFTSPFFSSDQANGSGYLKLTGYNAAGTPIIAEVNSQAKRAYATINGIYVTLYTKYTGDLNNYGVPGIKLADVTSPVYGNYNGYYERLLPGDAGTGSNTTSYLDFVTAKPFTFFTCWLGNNDILGYATSSGTSVTDMLTDKTNFETLYKATITALTKTGAKGVVVTIPDVTTIPLFNYLTVKALLAAAQTANPAAQAIYILALDASGNYVTRIATDNDLILLTFSTAQLGAIVNGLPFYGLVPNNPLLSKEVLDVREAERVKDYISSYNTTIKAVAATNNNLAVFDAYAVMNQLKTGITQDGVTLNANFITGGFFSLDGTHFTPRGNAFVANEMIKVINAKYGSSIPAINISTYNGVTVQ